MSRADQKDDLEGQVGRVVAACAEQGINVDRVVSEVGCGRNGNRPRMRRLLIDSQVSTTTIVVEHRHRLARFGVQHRESAQAATGRRIVVLDPEELKDDVVRDMVEVFTSRCARGYGRGSAGRRARVGCAMVEVGGW